MRKLASIQKIVDIRPISGADRIECAQVLGWEVVVRKDSFKIGDLVVYFEIDSALPVADKRFSFLAERKIKMEDGTEKTERKTKMINGVESSVLKSVKLRKQISQGLIISISDFPEIINPVEDMEVTELLKVQKYEFTDSNDIEDIPSKPSIILQFLNKCDKIPQPLFIRKRLNIIRSNLKKKKVGGNFPSFIPKTDEDRIQVVYNKLISRPDAKSLTFEATIKEDGSSATYFLNNNDYGVCSRNLRKNPRKNPRDRIIKIKKTKWLPTWLQKCEIKVISSSTDNFCKISTQYDIEKKLRKINRNLAIQGEVIGEGIQGNIEGIAGHRLFVFNIFDIDQQRYLTPQERWEMMDKLNENEDNST